MPLRPAERDAGASKAAERDDRAGRLLAVNLARPIAAAAAAGACYLRWRRPVSALKPATEAWVVQLSPSDAARLPLPGSGTGCGFIRRQWRRRSTQDQWRRKESDAEWAVIPQLAPVDHVPLTEFMMPGAPDNAAANTLRIDDDSGLL